VSRMSVYTVELHPPIPGHLDGHNSSPLWIGGILPRVLRSLHEC
jgi:hypothetical protein